jgi:hypothetical protein
MYYWDDYYNPGSCIYYYNRTELANHAIALIIWQRNNGSAYMGDVRKKPNKLRAFEKTLYENHIKHKRIPPRCIHFQGNVDSFHKIMEDELYDIESYGSSKEFLAKAYVHQLYFNYFRHNRWRENKIPVEILKEKDPLIDPNLLNLPYFLFKNGGIR